MHHVSPKELVLVATPNKPCVRPCCWIIQINSHEILSKTIHSKASFTPGEDDEGRYETMERIREVAKQARIIIGEVYGQGVMDTFSADLTCLGVKRGCPEKLPVDEV